MKTQNILKAAIGILEVLAVVLTKIEVNVNTKSTENDSGDNFSKAGGKSFSINFKFK